MSDADRPFWQKKRFVLPVKAAITVAMLTLIFGHVDLSVLGDRLTTINAGWAGVTVLLLWSLLPIGALRWGWVLRVLERGLAPLLLVRFLFIAQFLNQAMPSVIAGDAVRMWLSARAGLGVGTSVTAVILDRMVGVLGLVTLVGIGLAAGAAPIADPAARAALVTLVAVSAAGAAALLLFGDHRFSWMDRWAPARLVRSLAVSARALVAHPWRGAGLLAVSVGIHALAVLVFVVIAKAAQVPLSYGAAVAVVPPVLLISMVPVTLAGWGLREGAMVVGLGLVGIAEADALAVSILFGLLMIVAHLPGGFLWFALPPRERHAAEEAEILDADPPGSAGT